MAKTKVLYARVSAEAHAHALKKARNSREKDVSASTVVERLLLNDKRKQQSRARA